MTTTLFLHGLDSSSKGTKDTVCPPALVLPLAKETFVALEIRTGDDDHLLRRMFREIDWQALLTGD